MTRHPDDYRDTELGEHPFDAELQRSLGVSRIHIHSDEWQRREARRYAFVATICVGSIVFGMLLGVLFFCKGTEIRERLEAQLYGSQV